MIVKKTIIVLFISALAQCLISNAFASPEISHWKTSNGVGVYFVEAPEIPIIDVRIVYRAGSAQDGEKLGIANLTAALMDEGADDLDANAFNDRLADTGATFSADALRDMAWLSLRTLSDPQYATPALELLRRVVSKPSFADDAVGRAKAANITRIKRDSTSPGTVANNAIRKAIYGSHPYAHPTIGNEQSVSAITREDIVDFHRTHYVDGNAIIAIVGALSAAQAQKIAQNLASAIPKGARVEASPEVKALPSQTEQRLPFDSIQSHIRLGMPGMKRGDKDYVPLFVGNHVLGGGGLVSLLFDEVREKRGLSYGVNSYFAPAEQLGVFVASLQTDSTQVEEALSVLLDTVDTFIKDGPPADRLEAAKQNLIGGFPLRIDSNSKIIEYIAMIGFYGLPLDYLKTFPEKVAAVDAQAIKDAFARRVNLEKSAVVVVGKAVPPE